MKYIKYQVLIILIICYSSTLFAQQSNSEMLKQKTEQQLQEIFKMSSAITGLVAVDLTSGEKISWNPDVQFPQASSIKIPILMEVFKQAHEGRFALSDLLPVTSKNLVGGTGILKHLEAPAPLSIRNLSILMIALSDNSATNTLIDLVGISEINRTLKNQGMEQTLVQRKMMNSGASARGEENLATPAEAAKLLQLLYKGEFIDPSVSKDILNILEMTEREDSRLAAEIPGNVQIAFKPGFISGVSVEWAIIFLQHRPYAVAIMESHKIDGEAEELMEEVSEVLYQYYWRLGNASRYGTYVKQ